MEQERIAFGEHIKLLEDSIARRDSIHVEVRDENGASHADLSPLHNRYE